MAQPEPESLGLKTSFGEVVAKGSTVVLLVALVVLGGLALREHTKREAGEGKIIDLLNQQNTLLNNQTEVLRVEIDDVRCIVGISIFVSQFPRGSIEWDILPAHLHACYPDYAKKLPRK